MGSPARGRGPARCWVGSKWQVRTPTSHISPVSPVLSPAASGLSGEKPQSHSLLPWEPGRREVASAPARSQQHSVPGRVVHGSTWGVWGRAMPESTGITQQPGAAPGGVHMGGGRASCPVPPGARRSSPTPARSPQLQSRVPEAVLHFAECVRELLLFLLRSCLLPLLEHGAAALQRGWEHCLDACQ